MFKSFADSAGISAVSLSIGIRTILLASFFIWAAWCVLQLMKFHKEHSRQNIKDLLLNYVQLFFLVTIMIGLVFI
jgi:hypothetical protein